MAKRSLVPDDVEAYVAALSGAEPDAARRLREETAALPDAGMQIGPDQAAFFALLVRLIGARRTLEVGTFTGYSALRVAAALPPGGMLVACDVSEEWTRIARRYWNEAGVAGKIDLRLGPASDTLAAILRGGGAGSFDFAFIDADKARVDDYFEACLELLRPGGLVAVDNALWKGAVADPAARDADTEALRALNAKAHADPRVETCLLTIGDGVLLSRKQ